jgi:hypothetical protein
MRFSKARKHNGMAMVMALVFITVFFVMSMAMFRMSTNNTVAARSMHHANQARSTAESGLEIVRYWMTQVDTSATTTREEAFGLAMAQVDAGLAALPNVVFSDILDVNNNCVGRRIENIPLNSDAAGNLLRSVDVEVCYDQNTLINVKAVGHARTSDNGDAFSRTLQAAFVIEPESTPPPLSPLFGFGVATKGPFNINGGAIVTGFNQPDEGDIHINAKSASSSFYIDGSATISGQVSIVNPDHKKVKLAGNPMVNGQAVKPWWPFNPNNFTVEEINQRGIYVDVEEIEFPKPNPRMFRPYATGPVVTSSMSSVYTLDNAVIKAGTNPTFTGVYEIRGVLYIEQPNKVNFGGSCTISAIIVAEGDHENADPVNNKITWSGHVTNNNVQNLPDPVHFGDPDFTEVRKLQGVSVLAPGFELNIGATYNAYERFHGSIVGNGINFSGDPKLVINGTVLNYSDNPMTLSGSSKLYFDNKNVSSNPDGLEVTSGSTAFKIRYNPETYTEAPCI